MKNQTLLLFPRVINLTDLVFRLRLNLKGISKNGLWAMSGPYEIRVRKLPDIKISND